MNSDAFRQSSTYSDTAKVGVILYFYDPQDKLTQKDIDALTRDPKVRVIVKG